MSQRKIGFNIETKGRIIKGNTSVLFIYLFLSYGCIACVNRRGAPWFWHHSQMAFQLCCHAQISAWPWNSHITCVHARAPRPLGKYTARPDCALISTTHRVISALRSTGKTVLLTLRFWTGCELWLFFFPATPRSSLMYAVWCKGVQQTNTPTQKRKGLKNMFCVTTVCKEINKINDLWEWEWGGYSVEVMLHDKWFRPPPLKFQRYNVAVSCFFSPLCSFCSMKSIHYFPVSC